MKWSEIRKQHPDKFILIGGIVEEKISGTQSKIIEGKILKISDDGKEIRKAYQQYKPKGMNVLHSLPTTPEEFIIENGHVSNSGKNKLTLRVKGKERKERRESFPFFPSFLSFQKCQDISETCPIPVILTEPEEMGNA